MCIRDSPYALATAIFGGTVPMLQSWTYTAFSHTAFGIYVTAALVVSIVVTLTIPETRWPGPGRR